MSRIDCKELQSSEAKHPRSTVAARTVAILSSLIPGVLRMTLMHRLSLFLVFVLVSGCVALVNSPVVIDQLKTRSAGFTGCLPDANVITNVNGNTDGSGTWNATCKDKIYLCSMGSSGAPTYSCAVAVN